VSETALDGARWSWAAPTGLAAVVAALMVWLAGAPLDELRAGARLGGSLLEPVGDVARFPRRFAWTPVDGADIYEITVGRADGRPLFRQRGTTTELDVSFDAGAAPGPGDYRWEVLALRDGRPLGRAVGSFRVTAAP
jgi:hypothetical protein